MVALEHDQPAGLELDVRNVSHAFDLHGAPLPVLDTVSLLAELSRAFRHRPQAAI